MKYKENICPMKVIQISSKRGNEIKINPYHIEIGKNNRGICSRAYLIFDFLQFSNVADIEKAILYIPVINSNKKGTGTFYGFNFADFDWLDDLKCPLIPMLNMNDILFSEEYFKNSVVKVDLTAWVIQHVIDGKGGIILTTDENKREIALINGELNNNGIRLVIYTKAECHCPCTCECVCTGGAPIFRAYEKIIPIDENKSRYFTETIYVEELTTYTVFFKNRGTFAVSLEIQNSTNGIDFTDTGDFISVAPNQFDGTTAYLFSKYIRILVKTKPERIVGELTIQGRYYP